MEKHTELIAAILLNTYSIDRLYCAITNNPEPEPGKEITDLIEAWKHMAACIEEKTKTEES